MSIHERSIEEGDRLYFAYGSNLHLSQMAKRCPSSIFIGKATLHGYRWQINQRGVANVVESKRDAVEGLLFSVNLSDEESLDRSEGVSRGFYKRCHLKVDFEPVRDNRFVRCKSAYVAGMLKKEMKERSRKSDRTRPEKGTGRRTKAKSGRRDVEGHQARRVVEVDYEDIEEQYKDRAETTLLNDSSDGRTTTKRLSLSSEEDRGFPAPKHPSSRRKGSCLRMRREHSTDREGAADDGHSLQDDDQEGSHSNSPPRCEQVTALVYVSKNFTRDGVIRREYIDRMERAVDDARALEISDGFLDKTIRPCLVLPEVNLPDDQRYESQPTAVTRPDLTDEDGYTKMDLCLESEPEAEENVRSRPRKQRL